MERLLVEAAAKDAACIERYVGFASSGVTMANIGDLLNHAVHLKSGTAVHTRLMRVLPFLTYVDGDKMSLVIRHFEDVLDFERFDAEHGADDHAKVEAFVAMCEGIERNQVRKCSFGHRIRISGSVKKGSTPDFADRQHDEVPDARDGHRI